MVMEDDTYHLFFSESSNGRPSHLATGRPAHPRTAKIAPKCRARNVSETEALARPTLGLRDRYRRPPR